jgi:two-component system, cell cycle sensor histidine kinase and response regulator CckA
MRSPSPDLAAAASPRSVLFVRLASGILVAVGATVFVAWLLDVAWIKSFVTGTSTMKANTAVLFVLAGLALGLARTKRERRAVGGLATVVVVVAAGTLAEYALGRDFGLDQLLVADRAPATFPAAPGRMGINTAVSFILAGVALVLSGAQRSRSRRLSQWLAVTCTAIGAVSLTGYAYSVDASYGLTSYTQMAVHTAGLLVLLGLGVVFVNPAEGIAGIVTSPGPGGQMTRSVLPFVLLGPFVMGWLRLEGQQAGLYGTEFGVGILVIVSTTSLATVVMLYASRIDRADAATRLAEREARTLDERWRVAVSAARIGAWEVELATGRITCSDVFIEMLGLPPGSPTPNHETFAAMIHPDDRAAVAAAQARVPEAADDGAVEFRVVWPDGSIHWLYMRAHASRDAHGRPTRLLGAALDITSRKELEGSLRQAQKLEAVGQLAGGVAHDFNNVLTAVIGYSDLLLAETPSGTPLHDGLLEIGKAGHRASQITRQLLAFSRKQILQPRVLDINALIADLEKMLQRVVYEHVQIVTRLAPDVGHIRADPTQIEQVLVNLTVNARDAMPRGGTLTIETANTTLDGHYPQRHEPVVPGPYVLLSVNDSGVGMDRATQERLFEPFFTTKGIGKGTGLGLATVYGIVTQSGGHIWVYSEPGRGTTFKIYFPRVYEEAAVADSHGAAHAPQGGSETILLVEDEVGVRQLARLVLEGAGYRVMEAAGPQEALAAARGSGDAIQLLLSDVVMPGSGDVSLYDELAVDRPSLKVLYMSGYADETMVQRGWLSSDMPYLAKPFTVHELVQKVREVLDQPHS